MVRVTSGTAIISVVSFQQCQFSSKVLDNLKQQVIILYLGKT
jgi:hypothetical protein